MTAGGAMPSHPVAMYSHSKIGNHSACRLSLNILPLVRTLLTSSSMLRSPARTAPASQQSNIAERISSSCRPPLDRRQPRAGCSSSQHLGTREDVVERTIVWARVTDALLSNKGKARSSIILTHPHSHLSHHLHSHLSLSPSFIILARILV